MPDLATLYQQLPNASRQDLPALMEAFADIFRAEVHLELRPPCVAAFLTVENWVSTSQNGGVWTFYQLSNAVQLGTALQFLASDPELSAVFAKGLHQVRLPAYMEQTYPEEWIQDAHAVDSWIAQNRDKLLEWERSLLLDNQAAICGGPTGRDAAAYPHPSH